MTELSEQTLAMLEGGNDVIPCFFIGALFAGAIVHGNVFAAAGAGIYLAANCFK